jgi:hypothetical protein
MHLSRTQGLGLPQLLKLSLVAMFILSLATLSLAASAIPVAI